MVDYPWSLAESSGADGPGEYLSQYIASARDAACDYYSDGPGSVAGTQYENPLTAATDSLMRKICRPSGPRVPPAPQQPFTGGQCPVFYNVSHEEGTVRTGIIGSGTNALQGPIRYGRVGNQPDGRQAFGIYHRNGVFVTISTGSEETVIGGITGISRVDGLPDTCGNPSPILPESANGAPPPAIRGGVYLPPAPGLPPVLRIPTVLPTVYLPPVKLPSLPVPLPSPFPPLFQPQVNVQIGPFVFNFNLGGVTVKFGSDSTSPTSTPPALPPSGGAPPVVVKGGDCPDCCDDVSAILDRVKKLVGPGDYTETIYAEGEMVNGGSVSLPSKTAYVEVYDVVQSSRTSVQSGAGGPDVYFAGWVWYAYTNSALGERVPVDGKQKYYVPEHQWLIGSSSAGSFKWTMKRGCSAKYRVYSWTKL